MKTKAKKSVGKPDASALLRAIPRDQAHHPAMVYARGVLTGKIPAGELVKKCVARHLRDLARQKDKGFDYYFAPEGGQIVIDYIETFCCHSKGEWAGQPLMLAPWEQFCTYVIFGWKRKVDHLRRFRVAYLEVPRKQGKTTWMAAIGLYMMQMDGEPGAEVYAAATKKDQAEILWSEAKRMVLASPSLKSKIKAWRGALDIESKAAKFAPLASDEDSLDGLNTHCGLIDELHAHKRRDVWDVIRSSTGARRQPLQIAITTAGFNRNTVCWEQREYSVKVLDGIFEGDTHFAYIATIDEKDKERWWDPKIWAKANPGLGINVKMDDMKALADEARNMPGALNNFLTKRLNVWTQNSVAWMNMEAWDECGEPIDVEELKNDVCFGGLDLSSTTDLSALCLVFPPTSTREKWATLWWYWLPEDSMRLRVRRDHVPYDVWVKQKYIDVTPENVIDYDFIRHKVNELAGKFAIQEIAYDDWNATQLVTQLMGDGLTMVNFGQGFKSMNAPMKELEKITISRNLMHGGNPVARWNASNVVAKTDAAGNYKPDKGASPTQRIDGIVAQIMALGRAMVQPEFGSIYDKQGMEAF